MPTERQVKLEGKTYSCSFPDVSSITWVNDETHSVPPLTTIHKLNRYFLDNFVLDEFLEWGCEDLRTFHLLLRSLGAAKQYYELLDLGFLIDEGNEDQWRPRSPLHAMGYRVGKQGLDRSERQKILSDAVLGELPNVGTAQYMSHWGVPGSVERYRKIILHLQMVMRDLRPIDADYTEAFKSWEEDIEWLKQTFPDLQQEVHRQAEELIQRWSVRRQPNSDSG